jgi:hypothetical protein
MLTAVGGLFSRALHRALPARAATVIDRYPLRCRHCYSWIKAREGSTYEDQLGQRFCSGVHLALSHSPLPESRRG